MATRSFRRRRIPPIVAVALAVAVGMAARGAGGPAAPRPPAMARAPASAAAGAATSGAARTPASAIPAPAPAPTIAAAAAPLAPHAPGELLIKFRPGARTAERAGLRTEVQAAMRARFRSGAEHWRLPPGLSAAAAIERLARHPLVEYAEPNYIVSAMRLPGDPRFGEQHALRNTGQAGGIPGADIDAPRAWNVATGSREVVVAVIDSGVDAAHPDLAANIFANPGEIPGNGLDDDGNGFVDDARGWDFANSDNDPFDDNGHGTHVAGIIGAVGDNGAGVAGVAWRVSILPVKFLGAEGFGTTADAIRAIDYATLMRARVLNNSWGGGGPSLAMRDAIAAGATEGVLFVVAAGNNATDIDNTAHYPASYDLPNIVAVAATDNRDALAPFSNRGGRSVLLGAPGVAILSTEPGGLYGTKSGTSMAAPMVAGAAALLDALEPGLEVEAVVQRLAAAADPAPGLAGVTISGGRLNVFRLLARPDDEPPAAIGDLAVDDTGSTTARLRFTAPGDDGGAGRASTYDIRVGRGLLDPARLDQAAEIVTRVVPGPAGSVESIEVGGLDPETAYAFAVRGRDEWDAPGPPSNIAFGTTLGAPALLASPQAIEAALRVGQATGRVLTIANIGAGTLDWSIAGAAALPPWLAAAPAAGRVRAGEAQTLTLRLDAAGLAGGLHAATLVLASNDPARAESAHPVSLAVSDAPAIGVAPASIDFGVAFTGAVAGRVLTIANIGTADLAVAGLAAGDAAIAVRDAAGPAPFVLGPGGRRAIEVLWTPPAAGVLDSRLEILSDAANTEAGGTVSVGLRGAAVAPPAMAVAPASIAVTLPAGSATTRPLRIANDGGSDLDLALAAEAGGWLAVAPERAVIAPGATLDAVVAIAAAGLPAAAHAGRIVIDGNDPARPRLEVPVAIEVGDAPHLSFVVPPVVLESRVGFDTAGAVTAHRLEAPIPPAGSGAIAVTAQGDFGNPFERATLVVEGAPFGTVGGAGGECGSAAGAFAVAPVDLAALLADGLLTATIGNAASVDPACDLNRHILRLTYDPSQDRLDFGALLPGETRRRSVILRNDGSRDLAIASVTIEGPADPAELAGPFVLPPGGARPFVVPFGPAATAAAGVVLPDGALVVVSDDAGRPRALLPLGALARPAPDLAIAPAAIAEALLEGGAATRAVTLQNRGTEPIEATLAVEGRSGPAAAGCPARAFFVASYNAGEVRAVDPETGAAALVATGLFGPRAPVVDPDGRRLHVAEFSGRLATIDLATGSVTRVETGQTIGQGLAIDPAGGTAWMTSYGQGSILAIGLRDGSVRTVVRGLGGPVALALDPSGAVAHVVEAEQGTIARVDLATGAATLAAAGLEGARGIAVDPTGTVAWVSLGPRGAIAAVDLTTGAARDVATGLDAPAEIAFDRATGLLLVGEFGAGRVLAIDPGTGATVAAYAGLPAPSGIAVRDPRACLGRFADPGERRVTLPAGGAVDVPLRLDADRLAAGTWEAVVLAGPARPFAPLSGLPVTLEVTPRARFRIEGRQVALESQRTYATAAARTTHAFALPVRPGAGGLLEVTVEGDYGNARERATVTMEEATLGSLGTVITDCTPASAVFAIGREALAAAAADGIVEVALQNTADVAATCPVNRHLVRLRYASADPAAGVDFGDLTLGETRAIPLVVRNDGGAPLEVAATVAAAGSAADPRTAGSAASAAATGSAADPAAAANCTATPAALTVAPGAERALAVACAPGSAGRFEAILRFATNDPDLPVVDVALGGLGVEPPRLAVAPLAIAASVIEGATSARTLLLRNEGGRPLVVGAAVEFGPAGSPPGAAGPGHGGFVMVSPPDGTIPPGGAMTLEVVLGAPALPPGGHAAIIVITSNDPGRARIEVPVALTVLPDADGDGIADFDDVCPGDPDPGQDDGDGDGRGDLCDNCPRTANPGQEDGEADGSGDACQSVLIFLGIREDGGERLEVAARAFDPDGDPLLGAIRFEAAGAANPPVVIPFADGLPRSLPIGFLSPGTAYHLELRVTDGFTVPRAASASFVHRGESVMIIDMPPRPAIAAPAAVECDRPLAGMARLDGSASTDDDSVPGTAGDIARHEWFRRGAGGGLEAVGEGEVVEAALPLGDSAVVLRVTDMMGESAEAEAVVVVGDSAPPSLALAPDPALLWPPDRSMRTVMLRPEVRDRCDPSPVATLVGIASSEPAAGPEAGGGAGAPPGHGADPGGGCGSVALRAERDGAGPGRLYTVTCAVRDRSGNRAVATATIVVPHDRGTADR